MDGRHDSRFRASALGELGLSLKWISQFRIRGNYLSSYKIPQPKEDTFLLNTVIPLITHCLDSGCGVEGLYLEVLQCRAGV